MGSWAMARIRSLWSTLARRAGSSGRVRGSPTSSNGASSFHLGWNVAGRACGASVDLEILRAPVVDRLYFWAMQVDFADSDSRPAGGAHLGLQWHPAHPGSRAVNWGGYAHGGGELVGSSSVLRSATGNPNTRDLHWTEGHTYRLTVARVGAAGSPARQGMPAPQGTIAWRGSVSDLTTGDSVVVRDLWVPAGWIERVTMWSEVFARCDDPTVAVRWSRPRVLDEHGVGVAPRGVRVDYQSHAAGGCANTDSSPDPDGVGILQRTATARTTPRGTVLSMS